MLHATKRIPKQNLNTFRRQGKVPAIIYGHGFDSAPLLLDKSEFLKILHSHGEGGLFDLCIEEENPIKVILQDYQIHPVTREFLHIDLYKIRMDERLQTKIPLTFIGESGAVKGGGILFKNCAEIEVECLPQDLVSEIQIDLSQLKEIHDSIRISGIALPKGVNVRQPIDTILVSVTAAVKEEEAVSKEDVQKKIEELGKDKENEKKKEKEGEKKEEK